MIIDRRKHRVGGESIHLFWPLLLTLSWQTDKQFRHGPEIFEWLVLANLVVAAACLAMPLAR